MAIAFSLALGELLKHSSEGEGRRRNNKGRRRKEKEEENEKKREEKKEEKEDDRDNAEPFSSFSSPSLSPGKLSD